jgi:signal transduction histidine kinase
MSKSEPIHPSTSPSTGSGRSSGHRILYMEDDVAAARVLQKRLERAGYVVDVAHDGKEGLAMYAASSYDVVAVDQNMPVCDGLEVIRILALRGPLPPTIMVTGAGDEKTAVEVMKLGASDYIVKDVDGGYLELLPSVIERVLQQQRFAEEKQQAEEERERRSRELAMLNEIGRAVTSSLDLKEVLALLLDRARQALDAEACSVALLDDKGGLVFHHAEGEGAEAVIGLRLKSGQGIAGRVAQSGQSALVPDALADSCFYGEVAPGFTTRDMVCVPLVVRDEVIGVIELLNKRQRVFGEDDVRVLESVATQAATAIENARLHQEVQHRLEELTFLNRVGRAMTSSLDLEQVLTTVMEETALVLRTEASSILLLDEESSELVFEAAVGPRSEEVKGLRLPLEQGIVGWVAREGQRLLVPDVGEDPRFYSGIDEATGFVTRSVLAVPLKVKGRLIGVIEAVNKTESYFGQADVALLSSMAQSAVIAIENARLYKDLQDRMDELKRTQAQLLQAQKMEAIGQLAGGITHDFNNLLTPIGGFAELLLGKAPEGSKQHEYLRQIKIATERAAALTGQLRLFTRQEKGERRSVQLNSVVEETRDLLKRSIPKDIPIELRLEPELWVVEADPSQMSQVLMNLCVNARDAMPDGGTLTLETRNVTLDEERAQAILEARPGRYVCFSVSDTGCGMRPEVQARLFEPFFTTKEVSQGTGLGLSVVYGVVKRHNGFINVYSEEGRGSTFHVYLPAIGWAVAEREVERLKLPVGTETILLVDDEEMVRELGQHVLELCGYTVLMAEDGLQALEVYQAYQGEVGLVVLDVIMPQMGGRECLQRLLEIDLQVKVLISTGYTADNSAQELVAEGALGVVEKPFRIRDFAVAVRAALDRP